MAVGHEAGHKIHREIGWTAVAGMLNLKQVLQLGNHRFDQRASVQDDVVM